MLVHTERQVLPCFPVGTHDLVYQPEGTHLRVYQPRTLTCAYQHRHTHKTMPLALVTRDNILHLGDQCLFRALPDEAPPDEHALVRALARVAAHGMETWRNSHGLHTYPRYYDMSLLDAFCVLATGKAIVEIESVDNCHPRVEQDSTCLRIFAVGEWDAVVHLSGAPRPHESRAMANQVVRPRVEERCHSITVRGIATLVDLPPLVAPVTAEWNVAIDHPSCMLRFAKDIASGTLMYRCGILWAFDSVPSGVAVDVYNGREALLSHVTRAVADTIASYVLNEETVQSTALEELFTHMGDDWAELFTDTWRLPASRLTALVTDAHTPLWITRLIDVGKHLVQHHRTDVKMNLLGMSILRRMQAVACSRFEDWRTAVIETNFLMDVRVLPVSLARFGYLYEHACLPSQYSSACSLALVYDHTSGDRSLLVPEDIDVRNLTVAITTLCACSLPRINFENRTSYLTVSMNEERTETSDACGPDEMLRLFKLRLNVSEKKVFLLCDNETSGYKWRDVGPFAPRSGEELKNAQLSHALLSTTTFNRTQLGGFGVETVHVDNYVLSGTRYYCPNSDDVVISSRTACSLDNLCDMELPSQLNRIKSDELESVFPELMCRISNAQCTKFTAAIREIQSRRLVREWGMAGFDSGENLSSLGMSILLCLLLGGVLGCRVRVALSSTNAAMVAVHTGSSFVLVDPTRTLCNLFTASSYLGHTVASVAVPIRCNTIVEIRMPHLAKAPWRVALVRKIDLTNNQFIVQLLGDKTVLTCSITAPNWRRVSSDLSNLDTEVCKLLSAKAVKK